MNPPGKTTLSRMRAAADTEAERIEMAAKLHGCRTEDVARRDDFAGIVRLIDVIMKDEALLRALAGRLGAGAVLATHDPAAQPAPSWGRAH